MAGCRYGTLYNVRRSDPYAPPSVDFMYGRGAVPPQPQPVSVGPTSLVGSWLGYLTSKTMTGEQIDALREWVVWLVWIWRRSRVLWRSGGP